MSNDDGGQEREEELYRKGTLCCLNTSSVCCDTDSLLGTEVSDIYSARDEVVTA